MEGLLKRYNVSIVTEFYDVHGAVADHYVVVNIEDKIKDADYKYIFKIYEGLESISFSLIASEKKKYEDEFREELQYLLYEAYRERILKKLEEGEKAFVYNFKRMKCNY